MPPPPAPPPSAGAQLIAQTLVALQVRIVFGIVGIPIIEVAEALVAGGVRFVGFRNEQAASYAAAAYGYLTGRPGVLLVVGGPGVVHALAGVHGAQQNHFPLLVLCGAPPSTHLPTRGSFQTLSAAAFLAPHTKLALRAPAPRYLPQAIREAYRAAFWGRPGAAAVEISGDYVTHALAPSELRPLLHADGSLAVQPVPAPPQPEGSRERIRALAQLLMHPSRRPLIVVGKGAAYSRCEDALARFISRTQIPFLPTPMGKGLLPATHPLDASASRSVALRRADLVILLGARLNWILHFGAQPKLAPGVSIAKIDISAEELGRNLCVPGAPLSAQGEDLSIVGDCGAVLAQLTEELDRAGWAASPAATNPWVQELHLARDLGMAKLSPKLATPTPEGRKLTYHRAFHLLQHAFAELAGAAGECAHWADRCVVVSEGANTMDISRAIFPSSQPRQRLDAGTDAAMGVGLGYAIAAWCAYNLPGGPAKKIIAIEGDSAFGFSGMELETMARHRMDIVVVVANNGGVYRGLETRQQRWDADPRRAAMALPPTALSYHTDYAAVARGLGARAARLLRAVSWAWSASEGGDGDGAGRGPVLLDVEIESGEEKELVFAWLGGEEGVSTDDGGSGREHGEVAKWVAGPEETQQAKAKL
ncbi:thiamine pyrophosphate enzyme, N-terminal TPP binding domain-containing protein [Tirmania nivea]|nr:thiamine pyrophosphate enzyme, N-terminal TPP binding domain-containing protein [Tirmania nivea]